MQLPSGIPTTRRATTVALPNLTPEQRAAALEKAAAARRARAEVKNRLKYSQGSLSEVIQQGQTDDVIGKLKVVSSSSRCPASARSRRVRSWRRSGSPRHAGSAGSARTRRRP
ncbi:hypothetical protein GCM10025864_36830 [Luteimicrobium album]|uniref:Integration host factor-like helix-two turn-helix domain-containing protein n=1 Tax=Luteimicrobium album TaxID=1054550 RepID=A0ABQ6I820_9MICO|nr:hypothetical protein GCM10025864_36830 [Luteimicrobium album]